MRRFLLTLCVGATVCLGWTGACPAQILGLENHYTFDDPDDLGLDSSGNNRHAEPDEFGDVLWLADDERGGVAEFQGADDGFLRAELPELPGENFTIAFWAYRDFDLAGLGAGGNDGLFQVQLDGDTPSNTPTNKVIGGWVQKSDAAAWGRLHTSDATQVNLDNTVYFMEDDTWTHFAYRGDGETFELIVDGEQDLGPLAIYDGTLSPHNTLFIGKQGGIESWGGRLDDFRVYSRALSLEEIQAIMQGAGAGELGDFTGDGQLDAGDIDLLTAEVLGGNNPAGYDLDNSGTVDAEDRRVWAEDLKNTWFGDANLDGEFNSADLVAVFQAGQYEDAETANSGWATGDWNGDQEFNSGDFVAAFQGGGFEQGPRAAVASVPEPSGLMLVITGLIGAVAAARRRC